MAQSYFRYPLNRIFASEGAVRVLRELARHGGELSVPSIADATKLSREAVRRLLQGDLSATGVVERLGSGRLALYRLRADHRLRGALDLLFVEEEARVRRLFDALARAAHTAAPDVLAVWVYGSVARGDDAPTSDVDVALVLPGDDLEPAIDGYRAELAQMLDQEKADLSVVGLAAADVLRLAEGDDSWWRNVAADAIPVFGPSPPMLAQRLRTAPTVGRAGAA